MVRQQATRKETDINQTEEPQTDINQLKALQIDVNQSEELLVQQQKKFDITRTFIVEVC